MEENPCYEDGRLPVYEEVQLQDNVAEPTDVRVKQTERISSSEDKTNAATSTKKETNLKASVWFLLSSCMLGISMVIVAAMALYCLHMLL